MERRVIKPRDNWEELVESLGMRYHTIDDEIYWDESACYRFKSSEIDNIEIATDNLNELCLSAVEHVIEKDLFNLLQIPEQFVPYIKNSWDMDEPTLYGRFDLAYDGISPPKLLEYNADTPTALLEASVVQWYWLQDCFPDADQFNSIHEKLIESWQTWPYIKNEPLFFACASGSLEDLGNLEYLRDTAVQGGFTTQRLFIEEIGRDQGRNTFVDMDNNPIRNLFKLYPWEWLVREEYGPYLLETQIRMIEPAWKMILSNKGILPILWELNPGHPNLLEAYFEEAWISGEIVRKPLLSREGENISIRRNGIWSESEGSYGQEGYIYQRYSPLKSFSGNYPVTGSWIIADKASGIGIREDSSEITTNGSRFIPHYVTED